MLHAALLTVLLVLAGCVAAPTYRIDSLGIQLVHVPAGRFRMGSSESPEVLARAFPGVAQSRFNGIADEGPVHTVRITRDFWLGRHEVTVGQFRRFLEASGHVPESLADGTGGYGFDAAYEPNTTERGDAFAGRDPRFSWRSTGFAQGDDHPVVNVTWNDAAAMAHWLSAREGATYRLPTEAEWEYAARAGASARFVASDDPAVLARTANIFDRDAVPLWPHYAAEALPASDGHAFTEPVGRYAPNAFGLHDMLGNVWEWCADWHSEDYYSQSPTEDPTGPATGDVRVRRGGSWHTWPFYARVSFRNWNTPTTRYTLVGFRLLREVENSQISALRSPTYGSPHAKVF